MKIIVIGMDNTGKSTLCEQLSKELNLEHLHSLGYKPPREHLLAFMGYNLVNDKDVIFERFSYFDEIIYGPVLREESKFDLDDDFYMTIYRENPKIIYCRPPRKVIFNWGEREQMEGIIDNSVELLSRWDSLAELLKMDGFDIIHYDYTRENISDLIGELKDGDNLGTLHKTTSRKRT